MKRNAVSRRQNCASKELAARVLGFSVRVTLPWSWDVGPRGTIGRARDGGATRNSSGTASVESCPSTLYLCPERVRAPTLAGGAEHPPLDPWRRQRETGPRSFLDNVSGFMCWESCLLPQPRLAGGLVFFSWEQNNIFSPFGLGK